MTIWTGAGAWRRRLTGETRAHPVAGRGAGPPRWFLLVFGFLIALFVLVLLTESTSVGRGGR